LIRRSFAFALLFLIINTPLLAQSRRLVSRIEVRGEVPAPLVISQSALAEGRAYSDRDLDVAVSRIAKLPFVFDASYTMDGETLIIDVHAMTRFYAGFDVSGTELPHAKTTTTTGAVGGGMRFFAGSGGVAEVTADRVLADSGGGRFVAIHYSHYGIAGTRFFASAGIGHSIINDAELAHDPKWHLTVGYPLTIRQTLTASASGEGSTVSSRRNVNVRWSYDTTDDAFFARYGETVNASPSWTRFDSRSVAAFDLDATKYWAVGARDAIFSTLEATSATNENAASLTLGAGHNFFDWAAPAGTRQRVEVGLHASRRRVENASFETAGVTAAWTLRRQYMNVKLSFSFEDD